MAQEALNIDSLKQFIRNNPLPNVEPYFPALDKPLNQRKAEGYRELLDFIRLRPYAESAIKELKQILSRNRSLEQSAIRIWTLRHIEAFKEAFFHFGLEYLDSGNEADGNLHLPAFNEYVDKSEFTPIIQFWECMWLLYFGQYHLEKEQRTPEDPDYYHRTNPVGGQLSDEKKILNTLKLL